MQGTVSQQNMRPAAKVAEEFFEDIRDGHYSQAYIKLDQLTTEKVSRSRALRVLEQNRRYLVAAHIDQKFTYPVAGDGSRAVSCVQAKTAKRRRLYLTAWLVRRASSPGAWRVQEFKITSVPEAGCPI